MANSNIVTIANSNYYKFTERMIQSLRKTTQHNVLLFCDNAELFAGLQYLGGIEVIELASIKTHGIYRARFDAYNQAIKQGSFLYLDSDIIILEDISELLLLKKFSGCADDMSACSFIENKQFPWKDKNLENTRYINTGVFFAPQGLSPFFDEVYQESLDDAKWATYGDPILADNHFLNAYLNKHSIDIYYIDEYTYNWQGFIKGAELQVRRDGDHLYNIGHGNLLKVAHFAGIKTNLIESFIKSMPIEISNLLKSKVSALSDEEFFVQNIIESYKIRRAIECSPYEISGIDVLPIEFNDGTLEGAADNVCIINFDKKRMLFDNDELRRTAILEYLACDLMAIHSPDIAKVKRDEIVQLIAHINPKYLMFSNIRENSNLFKYQELLDITLLRYCDSAKGICLFRNNLYNYGIEHGCDIEINCEISAEANELGERDVILKMVNRGDIPLSNVGNAPVRLSYHIYGDNLSYIEFNNPRYSLPYDLHPHHEIEFKMKIAIPETEGNAYIKFDLIQEGVRWFHAKCNMCKI